MSLAVAAITRVSGRSAESSLRGLAFARHRDDRVGAPGRRQRHRRLAEGAAVNAAGGVARPDTTRVRRRALGLADDGGERLHGLRRPRADGRLARQHDRVGAFVHRVGGIADFGARGPRIDPHRLEHLRGDDHRTAGSPGAADDFLLDARDLLERHLEAEIAARHHHARATARESRPGSSTAAGRSILAISGTLPPRLVHQLARPPQIVRGLHEAQRNVIDAELEAEPQVGGILRR